MPALTLLVLGPWVAEYLLGSHTVVDLPLIVFLVPMYGGGALLIREVARRAGRGWPTMLLLGLAYGVIEAGLLDQSLFNPSYMDEDFNSVTHIPWLGVSATYVVAFAVGHTVWSIGTPIALVEAWWPARAGRPWLGRFGLGVAAALYLSGSALIRVEHRDTEQFTAATHQQVVAGLTAVALIAAAFLVGRRRPTAGRQLPSGSCLSGSRTDPADRRTRVPGFGAVSDASPPDPRTHVADTGATPSDPQTHPAGFDAISDAGPPDRRTHVADTGATSSGPRTRPAGFGAVPAVPGGGARPAPRPRRVALVAFLTTAAFICVPGNWVGVALALALVAGAAVGLGRWSRRRGWGPAHRAALAGGALMTQAGVGFILHPWHEVSPALELASDFLFAATAAAMGLFAVRHARPKGDRRRVAAWSIRVATEPGATDRWRRQNPPSNVSASSSGSSAIVP